MFAQVEGSQCWVGERNRCGVRRLVSSPVAAGSVDAGHELSVGGTGGSEVLVPFFELETQVDDLLFEAGDLLVESTDVSWGAEAGLAPGLLAEGFGEPLFQVLGSGVEPGGAFVGGKQVGLQ
jgi:hypothetical protein